MENEPGREIGTGLYAERGRQVREREDYKVD